ncbi:MAG TPA: polyprenyl synthetase family protein, partial [Polyangium sp.]|nr:polyprenyl synthetase family protein [Polyangium sp.]
NYTASESSAFSHAATYLLKQRGKRVRGLLTLASSAACGHDPTRALECAAAVEWLHQASLVIDDIIDRTDMRRGSPALHSITSPVFAGATTAFLLGKRLDSVRTFPDGAAAMLLDAELSLLKGECLELCSFTPAHRTISAYYRTIEAKTARLFSCAAALGALSGAPKVNKAHVAALAKYGREVGLAFQIVDDLRDYASNPAALGKRVGTDFDNGLATLPLLLLEKATEVPSGADFEWIRAAMTTHAIPQACLARAKRHIDTAIAAIRALPNGEGVHVLEHIAETTLTGVK